MNVKTDHDPLTSIWKKSIASTSTRVQRLLLRLLQYDIDIQYLPLPPKATDIKAINCIAENKPKTKMKEFQDSTCREIILQELAKTVHKGWPRKHKDCLEILHPYWTYRRMHIPRKLLIIQGQQANSTQSRKRANIS